MHSFIAGLVITVDSLRRVSMIPGSPVNHELGRVTNCTHHTHIDATILYVFECTVDYLYLIMLHELNIAYTQVTWGCHSWNNIVQSLNVSQFQ